ncbi:hypothetical protein M422DRAFT_266488 [Sphaerobolus stellatus SS14]|uniref:Uncharacterized protein n=1 Tax=Sphaerobolus stellatus (strain SS14) TaxID=990650 RepID=A0A0C9UB09_SPHS4|nr:hypothetical protein M422DRAFT_266488 [Sphaerobolus stellatus SS14]
MTICAYTLHQTTTVSNQTSHSPATGVDECAEGESRAESLPDGSSANENRETQPEQLEEDNEEVNGDPIQEQEQEQEQSEEESDYFNIESEDSEDSEDL